MQEVLPKNGMAFVISLIICPTAAKVYNAYTGIRNTHYPNIFTQTTNLQLEVSIFNMQHPHFESILIVLVMKTSCVYLENNCKPRKTAEDKTKRQ